MSPPSSIIIRDATAGDGPALGRLGALLVELHYGFDADRFIAPGSGTERGYGSFLVAELERDEVVILVAEDSGLVVGYAYAGLEGNDWMALRGPAGVIYDLIVDPARRREGIGRLLLEEAVQALEMRGAPRIVLSTAKRNEAAQSLFALAGFRATMVEMTRESRVDGAEPAEG
jgi:ribosomal protein S18 acetylase RimI-like enzyme